MHSSTDASPAAENRRSTRAAVRIEAWLETPTGEVVDCHTLDVADGGACVSGLGIAIQVGDMVRLSLMRSSAMDEGWLDAIVRWRTTERVGLQFLSRPREPAGGRRS